VLVRSSEAVCNVVGNELTRHQAHHSFTVDIL